MKNHYLTIRGETKTVADWCKEYGIEPQRYYQRKRAGFSDEDAIMRPLRHKKKKKRSVPTIEELAMQTGVTSQTYYRRLKKGYTKEEALQAKPYERLRKSSSHEQHTILVKKCRELGISVNTYYKRVRNGMTPEEALSTKKYSRNHTEKKAANE